MMSIRISLVFGLRVPGLDEVFGGLFGVGVGSDDALYCVFAGGVRFEVFCLGAGAVPSLCAHCHWSLERGVGLVHRASVPYCHYLQRFLLVLLLPLCDVGQQGLVLRD